jgi:hypothetical protein
VIDDGHRLAQILHQVKLVAREQDAAPCLSLLNEDLADDVDPGRIQADQGLVEHEDFRVVHQRRRQLHTLLVAMRQHLDLAARTIRHLQALQP